MNTSLLVVVLASVMTFCAAISCYDCTVTAVGGGDPKCADPFYLPDPPNMKECDLDVYTKCRKTKMYLANGKISIVRECAEQTCTSNGCKTYGGQTSCEHCCYGDLCNSARALTFDTFALLTAAILAMLC